MLVLVESATYSMCDKRTKTTAIEFVRYLREAINLDSWLSVISTNLDAQICNDLKHLAPASITVFSVKYVLLDRATSMTPSPSLNAASLQLENYAIYRILHFSS